MLSPEEATRGIHELQQQQPNNDAEEADVNRLTATVMAFYSGRGMTSGWIPGSFR
ncbi:hypothetical protein HanIR_Chr12g0608081 [Helianthus annuus]|nr:hypothetical protein HanIR_Chr12g0608081 [Helianthus annuus]